MASVTETASTSSHDNYQLATAGSPTNVSSPVSTSHDNKHFAHRAGNPGMHQERERESFSNRSNLQPTGTNPHSQT